MHWLSAALILSACSGRKSTPTAEVDPAEPVVVAEPLSFVLDEDLKQTMDIVLSEGTPPGGRVDRTPPADARTLNDATVERLLSRLPAVDEQVGDQVDFARRADSLPRPQVGETIDLPFPPPPADGPPDVEDAPLSVLRWGPDGEVPLAPNLSVTFSQPMVAIGTVAGASETLPVRLTPEPPGQWRWVGTQTLFFEPDGGQFPKATDYTIDVPAGTASAVGGALAEDFSASLSTPPVRLLTQYPQGSSVGLTPTILLGFDQQVDPSSLADSIAVTAGGDAVSWSYVADLDAETERIAAELKPGRYVALRPDAPLPNATGVQVALSAGAPSAEGPRVTASAQSFAFQTYGKLKISNTECGYRSSCKPYDTFELQLTNPLDMAAFETSMVEISPELPGAQVWASGNYLYIGGTKQEQTTYTVTLDEGITDVFGQTLAGDRSRTFRVKRGDRPSPYLEGFPQKMVVLDPAGAASLALRTFAMSAVDVRVYRVGPEDWSGWVAWQRYLDGYTDTRTGPPGELVHRERMSVAYDAAEVTVTPLALAEHLGGEPGHLVVWVQPTRQPARRWDQSHATSWVQSTGLGISAAVDATEVLTWVTDLSTGAPIADAQVTLSSTAERASAETSADGIAVLELPASPVEDEVLVVRRGGDTALLPENPNYWYGGSWYRSEPGKQAAWFVFDDRQMYRPGETVSVKGWIRSIDYSEGGDVGAASPSSQRLSWRLSDAFGNDVASGNADLSSLGGFDLSVDLPDTINLGHANLYLELDGVATHYHSVQVQEFRRPEFEASVTAAVGPHFLGETKTVSALGSYYAGGVLPGAPVNWTVTATEGSFTPPNHDDYQFGRYVPWWRWGYFSSPVSSGEVSYYNFAGTTDGSGKHHLDMQFRAMAAPVPVQVSVSGSITDVNRQTWSSQDTLLVHPSAAYVGVKPDQAYYDKGEEVRVDLVAVGVEGDRLAERPITMTAIRTRWVVQKDGTWAEEEAERHACAQTSAVEPVSCAFTPEAGGSFELVAEVVDAEGRPSRTYQTVWVSGAEPEPERTVGMQEVTLIPDKDRYAPGETAEILVQSPLAPAEALVTWRRQGIVHVERISLTEASTVLSVPITEEHLPNLHVQVDVVGSAVRTDTDGERGDLPTRPAQARGVLDLPVSTLSRTLTVEILPEKTTMMPGGRSGVSVKVTDASGNPVDGAEVALVAVDESVLALTGYEIGDPLDVFYPHRQPGARDYTLRSQLWLVSPPEGDSTGDFFDADDANENGGPMVPTETAAAADPMLDMLSSDSRGGGRSRNQAQTGAVFGFTGKDKAEEGARGNMAVPSGGEAANVGGPQIALRSNFDPLAMFAPAVQTDGDGVAALALELPDNLTRYRLTAVAVSGTKNFGRGESVVTAQLPLMVRPSPPRFLNFGDQFELPVVIQNQSDAPLDVKIAVRATNALLTDGGEPKTTSGRAIKIAGGDRVEVRFPTRTDAAGTARFQFAVTAGDFSDAAEVSLPVWTPATSEAFATYGQLDGDGSTVAIQQPVAVPEDVWPQFGGLEVTTSTTAVGALTDAVIYLVDYPYGCSEQISSRVLAIAALRDVLDAFDADGLPDRDALEASVAADIEELGKRQNRSGGFGFWRQGDDSWPYVSLHVAHALVRARDKGFEVPDGIYDGALRYARNVRSHVPRIYGPATRRTLESYALYIRHLAGDSDGGRAKRVFGEVALDAHPMEVLGWLLPVLDAGGHTAEVAQIHRFLDNRVAETAAAAHFVTDYGEEDYLVLHSDRRTDGVLLDALIRTRPEDSLIPKLVEGLLGSRVRGRWSSTQDNAFVLLAMDNYFNTYEAVEPDLMARVWLGERFVGEQAFEGRTTDRARIDAPMGWLQETGGGDVTLANEGAGRLYYRIGMRYAPKDLDLEARVAGFAVERLYEAVDDPADVQQDDDGTWRIRAGARVRVRLTLAAPGRRSHVALVDPLPAGLETLNPVLAVTEDLPPEPAAEEDGRRGYGWWWWRPWYDHENLRDERVEAFSSLLYGGVYTYTYVARATTPGTFVVPPAKAEEMYHPETFGRTAADYVVVTDP